MSKASNRRKALDAKHSPKKRRPRVNRPLGRQSIGRTVEHSQTPANRDASTAKGASTKPEPRHSLKKAFDKRSVGHSSISEISREATAGGVIYRKNEKGELEILLVADHFDRWTIPKGHIEEGETAQETAMREIGEEAGVHHLDPVCWLGKIHFRYRRENVLVLMSTQIYLFKALGDTNDIQKEDWMNGIRWFSYDDAVEIIAYKDIAKLMRLGYKRLQQKGEI